MMNAELGMTQGGSLNPPGPLCKGGSAKRRKVWVGNLCPAGFARKGETILTAGRDPWQHPSRPVSGRLSPVGATDIRQVVSTPASIGYANPGKPSPVGATRY